MKSTLKYTLVFIVVMVSSFFSTGLFNPSGSSSFQLTVEKDVETVFNYYIDTNNYKVWRPEYVGVKEVAGEYLKKGSLYEMHINAHDDVVIMKCETTNFEQNKNLSTLYKSDFITGTRQVSFESSGDKTIITVEGSYSGNSLLSKSILAFYGPTMTQNQQAEMQLFKESVEATN